MEETLKQYYSKTEFPTVYDDVMILNPRFSLFEEDTWSDEKRMPSTTKLPNGIDSSNIQQTPLRRMQKQV